MKKKFVLEIICVLMVVLAACGKATNEEIIVERESVIIEEMRDFVEVEEKQFILGENLQGAITQLALRLDTFDESTIKEEWYPTVFLSGFCQNSQFTFDYLEELREENEGILSREQVEFIQYSLTGEQLDLTAYVGEEGLDTYQAASGLGYGEIVSYEVNVKDGMTKLTAKFEYHGSNLDGEYIRTYNLDVELVKNNESCFDGYSIRLLSKEDVTSVEDMSVEIIRDEY